MGLNVSPLRRDQDPPQSKFTKFFRLAVIASSLAAGGATIASIPEDIKVVRQISSTPTTPVSLTITDKHFNLMGARLISLAVLGWSFMCWRICLSDDEREWMKNFERIKKIHENKKEKAV